jgi:hypothetical protein
VKYPFCRFLIRNSVERNAPFWFLYYIFLTVHNKHCLLIKKISPLSQSPR